MKDIRKYLKFYFLEEYLFGEVTSNFRKGRGRKRRHYLTPEEFFAIVIWKSNRAKTGIKISSKKIQEVTSSIYEKERGTRKPQTESLRMLDEVAGIGIPMASAILTVCYPKKFTIVDYRSRNSLEEISKTSRKRIKGNPTTSYKAYFEFLAECQRVRKHYKKLSLRDLDRALWGMDFYEGENGLKGLSKS